MSRSPSWALATFCSGRSWWGSVAPTFTPAVKNRDRGTRVACQCRAACGYCRGCLMGRMQDCENGHDHRCIQYFSELVAVDRRSVWPIGDLSDRAAMLLEPM